MKAILGEARFYFAQCVFNCSCQYEAYGRYEKERNGEEVDPDPTLIELD